MTDPTSGALRGPRRPMSYDGAERAIAAGRKRLRHRRLSTTAAGVSLATAAGVAVVARPDPSASGLVPADPAPSASPSASPSPTTSPSPSPTALPTLAAGPTALPWAPLPTVGIDYEDVVGTPYAPPPRPRGRFVGTGPTGPDGLPAVTVETRNEALPCTGKHQTHVLDMERLGFCFAISGPTDVTVGTPAEFTFDMCRFDQDARTLTYDTRHETAFTAVESGGERPQWSWGDPAAFPADRHTITFQHGDCMSWTVEWMGQDSDGYALTPGLYDVTATPWTFEWVHEDGDETGPLPVGMQIELSD